ncbi:MULTISPECIES: hypothetical protein [Desulfosediminicola]|uniref:hypothetical protein n=1 Tax=Desulfosediminicola TaxID=2886823 RepID=UPI0010AD5BF9|nr:hypothetical protein [Desulfosediminicola ganghwensis]
MLEEKKMQTKKSKKAKGTTKGRRNRAAVRGEKFNFTPNMRFVVVRNQRNPWLDELYETPPNLASLPVFN